MRKPSLSERMKTADQATGNLYLNLKSFEVYCGCLSHLSSKIPSLYLAAGDQPSFILLHRDSHLKFILRQLLNLARRVVKAQMGFSGSGLSPSSATDFLRDLGQVFSQGSQNLAIFIFF